MGVPAEESGPGAHVGRMHPLSLTRPVFLITMAGYTLWDVVGTAACKASTTTPAMRPVPLCGQRPPGEESCSPATSGSVSPRPVTVPLHAKLKREPLRSVLRDANIMVEDFEALLQTAASDAGQQVFQHGAV